MAKANDKSSSAEALAMEASSLRAALEAAAVAGTLDLRSEKHRTAHEKLDALERTLYEARHPSKAGKP